MKTYQITYGHTMADCTPGTLTLKATTDTEAIKEIREFVAEGYRNETWAAIELADGRFYNVRNVRGEAAGTYA
jgi:hypothetical protein